MMRKIGHIGLDEERRETEWDEDEQVKIEINDFFHPPIIEVVDIECDESCPKIYEMEDAHASIGYWARDKFIFY